MKIELNGYSTFVKFNKIPAVIYQNNFPSLVQVGKITFSYYFSDASDGVYNCLSTTVAKFTITKIKKQQHENV